MPEDAPTVLIIDAALNTTDDRTLGALGSGQWTGITYAANTGKLYSPPRIGGNLLIVDPLRNLTDVATMTNFRHAWGSAMFVAQIGKVFACGRNVLGILIVDPVSNTFDELALSTGQNADDLAGIAFAPTTNRV